LSLNGNTIEELFKIVGSYHRFKILEMLRKKSLSMDELAREFNISIPAVSKHLSILEKEGIISYKSYKDKTEGRPKHIYYLIQKVIPRIIIDDEIQAIEFYKINPRVETEEYYDIEEVKLKKTLFQIKLRKLEKKKLKILKELERLERVQMNDP